MSGHRKPRRVRWAASGNSLSIAVSRASKLSPNQIQGIMEPVRASHKALREGVASLEQWQILASAVEMALGIESSGVVTGLREHFKTAETTLATIRARAVATGTWRPTALHFYELEHVAEAVDLHAYQLGHVSEGELREVARKAVARIRSAGGTVLPRAHV